ncbi:MAG: tetratricopeptide repeat protein [Chthoniobacterales bacterium]
MNSRNFFAELKRRNVYKVAVAYAVVGWLVIQIGSTVLPTFHAPDWVAQTLVVFVLLGFPIALVLAWAFEITPEGIKLESEVSPNESITRKTGRKLIAITIGLAVIAAGLFAFQHFRPHLTTVSVPPATTSAIPEKSIAVLPFENLSSDKENAYFAEGIQDEILTRLAKISALKVISRTSTVHYASSPDNLPEIGKQLGVSSILEGSVQKAGQEVHINVQLIKAATDTHLWAESYNRKLDDIFAVEGEVAGVIAEQLDARLSGREKESLAAKPTSNTAAHDAYLRGLAFEGRVDSLLPNTLASIKAYEEAVRLDPDFGLAWAHLCRQHGFLWNLADRTPANKEAARQALAMAKKLAPDAVETELAEVFYHYWVERDYEGAKTLLESARQQFPNNPWPAYTLAAISRRQNHWEESRRVFAQAIELDPEDVFLLVDASLTDIALRDPVQALKLLARARDLSPQNGGVMFAEATSYLLTGDTTHAQAALDRAPPEEGDDNLVVTIVTTAILSRNYQPALTIMRAQLAKSKALGAFLGSFQNLLGDLQRHAGNASAAAQTYAQARASLEEALQTQPNDPDLTMSLAWSETWLGDKDDALAHAQQAITIVPATKDAWIGPDYEDTLARIDAHFGDKDGAIAAIRHLLSTSYGLPPITTALLRIDPDWDNLRDDPRFQALLSSPSPSKNEVAK